MTQLLKGLLVVYMLFSLSGCAFFYSLDKDLDQQVDKWLVEHEYAQALDALELVRKTHPKYALLQKKKAKIVSAAKEFENSQLKKVDELTAKQQWDAAEKIFNYSLGKLPESEKLQLAYEEFQRVRANYLKSLYYQLYINKAEWLIKNRDVNAKLERALPDDRATRNAIREHNQEIQDVYQQLLVCGIEGMNLADYELAEQCFLLANELHPSKEIRKTLVDVQKLLSRHGKGKPVKLSRHGRNLLEKSRKLMESGKLELSRDTYNRIPASDKRHALVRSYKQELDNRIEQSVSQGIEVGRKLYSQGEVEQALAIWNNLRKLAPDNEHLVSHIERAKRVLEKLHKLRKQDGSSPVSDENS